jgi:uncharacterized protein YycO
MLGTMLTRLRNLLVVACCLVPMPQCATRSPLRLDDPREAANDLRARHAAAQGDALQLDAGLDQDIDAFQGLVARGLVERARLIELARQVHVRIRAGEPIGAALQHDLTAALAEALATAGAVFRAAALHEPWLAADGGDDLPELPPRLRAKGGLLACAGSLFLYDTYLATGAVLADDPVVRRALNQGDLGYGVGRDQLEAVTLAYHSAFRRAAARRRLAELERLRSEIDGLSATDPRSAWLALLISQSPARERLRVTPVTVLLGHLSTASEVAEDDLVRLSAGSMNTMSSIFGNAVGLVETRKGRLYGRPEIESVLRQRLQPGDILLEKTPFRLTDRFIPGHWGHAAIWLGGEEDLRRLGLWDDPLLAPHRAALAQGRGVCEALRDGVQLNPLGQFLNVDDCAVLRQPDADRPAVIRQALRQVGKRYDFNFDVDSADTIVCSELVYTVYTGIHWPTTRTLGRFTITPDQVAQRALANGPLVTIALWHDGREETAPAATLATLVPAP